jgi:hypothetical protein
VAGEHFTAFAFSLLLALILRVLACFGPLRFFFILGSRLPWQTTVWKILHMTSWVIFLDGNASD